MKEALRLALGALQRFIKYDYNENPFDGKDVEGAEAITAIKAALAQPEQEPVAWWNDTGTHIDLNVSGRGAPLYKAPPQRTWVGLTDEEIWTVLQFRGYNTDTIEIAKAIETKLKEKNT